jgi:nitrogen PTS system EIIA component
MDLSKIFLPADVFAGVSISTKQKALKLISAEAADALGVDATNLMSVLEKREALGSTGIGKGIAVPHAPFPQLGTPRGFIFRCSRPLDFDAIDDAPVDLIFLLLFGEEWRSEYLKALAAIARKAHCNDVLEGMRRAEGPDELYSIFMASE